MNTQDIINQCYIQDGVVKLPEGQLERKLYTEVAARLEGIGGKWKGGKVFGFVFGTDPAPLLERIQSGEKINLKKDFQFFETPPALAKSLVSKLALRKGHKVLEPSAGRGAILRAIWEAHPLTDVDCCELMDENYKILDNLLYTNMVGTDFLQLNAPNTYNRIVANPPFTKNQDIDHVLKMYECLKISGRLVTVTSRHWEFSNNKKESEFRRFIMDTRALIEDVPRGTFSDSGTEVAAFIVHIDKV